MHLKQTCSRSALGNRDLDAVRKEKKNGNVLIKFRHMLCLKSLIL